MRKKLKWSALARKSHSAGRINMVQCIRMIKKRHVSPEIALFIVTAIYIASLVFLVLAIHP